MSIIIPTFYAFYSLDLLFNGIMILFVFQFSDNMYNKILKGVENILCKKIMTKLEKQLHVEIKMTHDLSTI